MSTAVDRIFSEFIDGGWDFIQRLKAVQYRETLHVDFTVKEKPAVGKPTRSDRKQLSTALSGFANSEGGILVWGVNAREEDGVDVVQGIQPISEVDVFHSRCHSLIPELVSPYVAGAEVFSIPDAKEPSRGVLLLSVPESESTPHMAIGPGMHRYYRRSGHTFRPMEHYEVADMFGRRPVPKLGVRQQLRAWAESWAPDGRPTSGRLTLNVALQNSGRGLARFPALTLGHASGGWRGHANARGGFVPTPAPAGWWQRLVGGTEIVVYPDDETEIAEVVFHLPPAHGEFTDLAITFDAVADGCPRVSSRVGVGGADLLKGWRDAVAGRKTGDLSAIIPLQSLLVG